jgi:uncharacterized protein
MVFDTAWLHGLGGGLLIGLASALFLLGNGRIAGMSGITLSSVTNVNTRAGRVSATFLLAAFAGALAVAAWLQPIAIEVTDSVIALVASGVMVGIGVTLANGCTSGHGVCGLSRLSLRSLAATLTFMGAAALSVFLLRHVVGVSL